jgi:hypothetical protein
MSFLPALSLALVLYSAADPVTTSTAKPVADRGPDCETSLVSTAAWTALGALFGGLVGYTAVSREHGDRPGTYVGIGVALGATAGFAASRYDRCEAAPRHAPKNDDPRTMTDGR